MGRSDCRPRDRLQGGLELGAVAYQHDFQARVFRERGQCRGYRNGKALVAAMSVQGQYRFVRYAQ